jgi:hypothetical protein
VDLGYRGERDEDERMLGLFALITICFVLGYWAGKFRGYQAGYRRALAELSRGGNGGAVIDIRPRD